MKGSHSRLRPQMTPPSPKTRFKLGCEGWVSPGVSEVGNNFPAEEQCVGRPEREGKLCSLWELRHYCMVVKGVRWGRLCRAFTRLEMWVLNISSCHMWKVGCEVESCSGKTTLDLLLCSWRGKLFLSPHGKFTLLAKIGSLIFFFLKRPCFFLLRDEIQ